MIAIRSLVAFLFIGGCGERADVLGRRHGDAGQPARGLLGYWKLDDPAGSLVAADSSGSGNNGQMRGGTDPGGAWVPGRFGGAVLFGDRANAVIVKPSPSIDGITDAITLAAWVNPGMAIPNAPVLERQAGTTSFVNYGIRLAGRRPAFLLQTDRPDRLHLVQDAEAPGSTWFHMAATYDGQTAVLYVGGVEVARAPHTGKLGPDVTPVLIGANNTDGEAFLELKFKGMLDEVRLYRTALSPQDVAALAAGTPER